MDYVFEILEDAVGKSKDAASSVPGPTPSSTQALFAAALRQHQSGRLEEAERSYRAILGIDPRHAETLHFLGVLAHQTHRLELAAELISRAIALNGSAPVYHNNLGNVLQGQGKLRAAAAAYQRALRLKSDYAAAHFNLGHTLQAEQDLAGAVAAYSRAIACRPDYAEAHGNLGNVLQAQGMRAEAIASYRRALHHRPHYAEVHANLGNVLKAQGLFDEALAAYQDAIRHRPDYVEAHSNRAILLLEIGRLDEAAAACREALSRRPDDAQALTILGHVLREQGHRREALAAYERALRLAPDCAEARMGLTVGVIPLYVDAVEDDARAIGSFTRSLDELAAWNVSHPGKLGRAVGGNQPFYLAYGPGNLCAPLSRYGDVMCAAAAAEWQPRIAARPANRERRDRIRLLIVCGQVREHPVWDVILRGIVAHIDRRRVELMIYHTGSIVDAQTNWAAGRTDRFVQGPKPIQAWLNEIAGAAPDVIFYPELGMDPASCALAALRLAPRQIASWGHPITTGLPTIDQFLSGELLEGPDAERHYREQLVRLPGTGVCTEPVAVEPQAWDGRARAPGVVRFALCQQPIKFDPRDDVLFTQIAGTVGPSEFWLVAPQRHAWATTLLRERLARAFRAAGLEPERHLRIAPWMSRPRFAGFLDAMDVYLDCPAFSGYTTAWQAVHRGLPIVTLEGDFLRQRLAAGLLRQMNTPEGIAASRDRYVDVAAQWAIDSRDPARRAMRRIALGASASRADDNRAAVSAFQTLIDARP